ncbi:UDP-N-acetylmuramoyl-tripeptide--D-alanyl-D-alanine ligase [Patescibacteria group bacterium]|nr:UDP-N-acetylmuramoyl-tripeptide--D-alanyl-D-alanine ligase [Patescibacteria group bacterium]MBU1563802.1 UDP-N-acetylmuramoyl-tripeptide--D-alanyl-D-alanine ligase [Patescibacteria group bacterium]
MRSILEYILKILAKIVIWRYQPIIVAVTGSIGKTSTKEAIYYVLRKKFRVRRNLKNYNNEIGVPLTILGLETGGSSVFSWLINFLKAILIFFWSKGYPEILILEIGVDKPGDMKYLLDFIPVKIGVFTAIGEFPVHLEFFQEKGKLVKEKAQLVESLPKDGLAILNYDDLSIRMVGDELSENIKTLYYGFGEGADIKINNYELKMDDFEKGKFGISFKLEHEGSNVPIKLKRVLGKQQCFIAAAAASVGLYFGLNLVEISSALGKYRSLAGRTKLLQGVKNTWIIDDSYNASPLATIASLELLEEFPGRKIAVLGDMLELGQDTEIAHRQVGKKAASVVDLLFVVGSRSVFIADQARQQGLDQDQIFEFSQSSEAGVPLQEKIQPGDIILIKGSRSIHMEKITKEIMAHPEEADRLLVQ